MKKIKLFTTEYTEGKSMLDNLETRVNNFISSIKDNDIIDVKQTESLHEGNWSVTIMVYYNDKNE